MTLTLPAILALPCIGEGNFRRVYRDGDKVYKIEYGEGIDLMCNYQEWKNAQTLTSLPANVAVPSFDLYYDDDIPIIVSDYIDGRLMGDCYCVGVAEHDETCLPIEIRDPLMDMGIDTAYGNVILLDDCYYIVDLDADLG